MVMSASVGNKIEEEK